jgi:hypothetical protein
MMRVAFVASVATVASAAPGLHEDRLAQIQTILDTPGVLWTPAVNGKFASEAPGASKSLCGVKGDWKGEVAAAVDRGEITPFAGNRLLSSHIPEAFDSATNWPQCAKTIGDIRDQSNCGCFGLSPLQKQRLIACVSQRTLPCCYPFPRRMFVSVLHMMVAMVGISPRRGDI